MKSSFWDGRKIKNVSALVLDSDLGETRVSVAPRTKSEFMSHRFEKAVPVVDADARSSILVAQLEDAFPPFFPPFFLWRGAVLTGPGQPVRAPVALARPPS